MAVGDTLGVGISGLLAFQRSLSTVGHNIANVNTEGYSRQRVELATRPPQYSGGGYVGTGVAQSAVKRLYDDFITTQVRTSAAMYNASENFYTLASRVDNLLADPQAGLTPSLQSFFNAAQGVANDPSSLAARQVMLTEANTLADRFHYMDQRLTDLDNGVNVELRNRIDEINGLAQAIASINKDISLSPGRLSGQLPNDLLDKRDVLLSQLSERVAVTTTVQDDGSTNVFIGSGQALVAGFRSQSLSAVANQFDPTRVEVGYQMGSGTINISDQLSGGKLGGALEFRSQVLDAAKNILGRVAFGLADSFNDQHKLGQDLNNALGGDFFRTPAMQVQPRSLNTGTSTVTAALADANNLTTSDYRLTYVGANAYTLTRLSDNQVTNINTGGSYPYTSAPINGFTLTIGAGAAVNDSYLIQPTRPGARDIGVTINDARNIAAAAPIRTSAALANVGSAKISEGVVDTLDPNLLNKVSITFTSSGLFDVVDTTSATTLATNVPYVSGQPISFNGWTMNISGVTAAGDVFNVGPNTNGVSDNRNGLLLAKLQTKNTLGGGMATYQDAYNQLVADVGTQTHQSDITRTAQKTLHDQSIEARDALSGVNLDEEAANMVRLQQAYQAAAQVISVSNDLFRNLMIAIRR